MSAPEGDFPVTAASGAGRPPWEVLAPERQTAALVFASPHSGSDYPADFLAASRLDALALRRSEDAFVDRIFACVTRFGAPLIRATFPRYRYDQLMRLGWKVFLPLSMFWVVLTGGALIAFDLVP